MHKQFELAHSNIRLEALIGRILRREICIASEIFTKPNWVPEIPEKILSAIFLGLPVLRIINIWETSTNDLHVLTFHHDTHGNGDNWHRRYIIDPHPFTAALMCFVPSESPVMYNLFTQKFKKLTSDWIEESRTGMWISIPSLLESRTFQRTETELRKRGADEKIITVFNHLTYRLATELYLPMVTITTENRSALERLMTVY